jgi:hypothetical protein
MSFYRWCMRAGAPILFAIAVAQLALGLAAAIRVATSDGTLGTVGDAMSTLLTLQTLLGAVASAALPFFGALLIDRLDRRSELRNEAEAAE